MKSDKSLAIADQLQTARDLINIDRLLSLDSIWTRFLESNHRPSEADSQLLITITNEMLELLTEATLIAPRLNNLAKSNPHWFQTQWADFQKSRQGKSKATASLQRQVELSGGILPYLQVCAEGVIGAYPTETQHIEMEASRIRSNQQAAGDLEKKTKCFLLGVGVGLAIGLGPVALAASTVGTFLMVDECG